MRNVFGDEEVERILERERASALARRLWLGAVVLALGGAGLMSLLR